MEVCEVMQRVRGKGAAPDDGVVGGGQEGSGRERARPQRLARVTEGWDGRGQIGPTLARET